MPSPPPTLAEITQKIRDHQPQLAGKATGPRLEAAVAIVIHDAPGHGPELLLMQRAEWEGDPWSGHMAFPGGRRDPEDADLQQTSARETLEEMGFALGAPIGRLDDFQGTRRADVGDLRVAPFVYRVDRRPTISPNHEVRSTVWIPTRWMLDPASLGVYKVDRADYQADFPCIDYEGYRVWGLTYRILTGFFEILGRKLPSAG